MTKTSGLIHIETEHSLWLKRHICPANEIHDVVADMALEILLAIFSTV